MTEPDDDLLDPGDPTRPSSNTASFKEIVATIVIFLVCAAVMGCLASLGGGSALPQQFKGALVGLIVLATTLIPTTLLFAMLGKKCFGDEGETFGAPLGCLIGLFVAVPLVFKLINHLFF